VRPAFDDGPVLLRGRRTDDGTAELVAFDHHGHPTMRATASFEG
jgi:hypothetical protein